MASYLERCRAASRKASELAQAYSGLDSAALLRVLAHEVFPGRIAVSSSFGAEAAVLLELVASVDPTIPVLFIDTGKLFPETLAYRDTLRAALGFTDIRVIGPDPLELAEGDPAGDLWSRDTDACCHLRKVLPMERALAGFDAWINGRKRFHAVTRAEIPVIEADEERIKINPLALWEPEAVEAALARLPAHPLLAQGFPSIGCAPCTHPVKPGEDPRSGRWAGMAKTECGIHKPRAVTP